MITMTYAGRINVYCGNSDDDCGRRKADKGDGGNSDIYGGELNECNRFSDCCGRFNK